MLIRSLVCIVFLSLPFVMMGCGGPQGGDVAENADQAAIDAYEAALKEQEGRNADE